MMNLQNFSPGLMAESDVLPGHTSALCHSGSHHIPPRCGSHQLPLYQHTEKYAKAKLFCI